MSASAPERKLLPLFTPAHEGGRSKATCEFRCGNACFHDVPNESANTYFGDMVTANASRRAVLKTGGLTAAVVGLGTAAGALPAAAAGIAKKSPFGFTAIDAVPAGTDAVGVPAGFTWDALIAWGDPLFTDAPAFDFEAQTEAAQLKQFGYNNDYVGLVRTANNNRAALVVNHEYTNDNLMFAGYTSSAGLTNEQLRIIMAAHGLSVVEVTRANANSPWAYEVGAPLNRRIHTHTEFAVDGPAAGSDLLKTSADPAGTTVLGTLNNCAGGMTPWGTILSGEENFNQYFVQKGATTPEQLAAWKRYGIAGSSGRGWERVDSRFDLAVEPNEANRFGWVVEIDPLDPTSTPVKHTAMGRFKHEGANVTLTPSGHVVAYMGDDERFDYVYKFVSHGTHQAGNSAAARAHNKTLLSSGDLYVATFVGDGFEDGVSDGTGHWIPLVVDNESKVPGFTVEQVLVHTRLAADKVGPTKMDRPEDVEVNLVNGRVYVALTNNSARQPAQIDEANPRSSNKHGQVLELTPDAGDHLAATYSWKLVLIAGNPSDPTTYFNGYDKTEVSSISCPDNVAFDRSGNLWISTDGNALGNADGLFLMPLEGDHKGHLQQFLSVPAYAECCGPLIAWDDKTVFAAIQHPGESDDATYENPTSLFPYRGDRGPRPAVIQIRPEAKGKATTKGKGATGNTGARIGDQGLGR
ncbi:PhoX family protein [Janibacter sp. G56]|uniref:PhoX family protein n=1 Tax=Janibacter sp. G56 TaxID=3418717 RepID=UPI003CFE3793